MWPSPTFYRILLGSSNIAKLFFCKKIGKEQKKGQAHLETLHDLFYGKKGSSEKKGKRRFVSINPCLFVVNKETKKEEKGDVVCSLVW